MRNTLALLTLLLVATTQAVATDLKSRQAGKSTRQEIPKFVQIVFGNRGIPIFLDSNGHVWTAHKPREGRQFDELYQLPKLEHIKKIATYMALDDKGRVYTWEWDEKQAKYDEQENLLHIGFTTPKMVAGLEKVTDIDNQVFYYFTAVVENKYVYIWKQNEPVRLLISRDGIKAISALAEFATYVSHLVILLDRGDVIHLSWTLTKDKEEITNLKETLVGNFPGAAAVAMNRAHLIVLPSDGIPRFWGSCFSHGKDVLGNLSAPDAVNGMKGNISNVAGLSNSGDDSYFPDVFIKRDGSIWAAHPPIPEGEAGHDCYQWSVNESSWELKNKNAVTIKTTSGGLLLDSEGNVWGECGADCPIYRIELNLVGHKAESNGP